MTPIGVVRWSDAARRELPALAKGRGLVVDYFATRCCGSNVSVGDLLVGWRRADAAIAPDLVPIASPDGVNAWMQRDLVGVVQAARGRVEMRGFGRLRRASLELDDGTVWLDFVGTRRPRSPTRR